MSTSSLALREATADAVMSAAVVADAVTFHESPLELEAAWRALETTGHATMFQRFDWVAPWYEAEAAAGRAEPLIAACRDEAGEVVMILPLCKLQTGAGCVIEIAGFETSDYAAPVMARSSNLSNQRAAEFIIEIGRQLPGDLLRLRNLPRDIAGRRNPLLAIGEPAPAPLTAVRIALDRDFEGKVAAAFDSGFRRDIQRTIRKLAREIGEPELVIAATPTEATALFDAMVAMRRERFAALGREDIFDDAASLDFYRRVFTTDPAAGFGLVFGLKVAGEIVAADLCVRHGDALHILAGSFRMDGAFRRYGLGNMLTVREMEWAATAGLAIFDLTIGAEDYKFRFGAAETRLYDVVRALSWRALPDWAAWRGRSALRQRPAMLDFVRRMRDRVGETRLSAKAFARDHVARLSASSNVDVLIAYAASIA